LELLALLADKNGSAGFGYLLKSSSFRFVALPGLGDVDYGARDLFGPVAFRHSI
jgi:hypothetical protein